jgi:hypothetical protein
MKNTRAHQGILLSSVLPFLPSRFPDDSFPVFPNKPNMFPVSVMSFSSPRLQASGNGAFSFPPRTLRFPHAWLFVRRHPGGPAYGTCTRAVALYPFRLARGCTPSNPARPVEDSGQANDKRRKGL